MCYVVMEGPTTTACRVADESPACIANSEKPSQCSVQYNQYPSCWNETICSSVTIANGWVNATEYTTDDIGWGRSSLQLTVPKSMILKIERCQFGAPFGRDGHCQFGDA